jgi:chromosome segregation ATPase
MDASVATLLTGVVTAIATGFGTWGLMRNKRMDTAQWLVSELRKETANARTEAHDAQTATDSALNELARVRIELTEVRHRSGLCEEREVRAQLQIRALSDRVRELELKVHEHERGIDNV